MSSKDFDRAYSCTFTEREREVQLDDRLSEYYRECENSDGRTVKVFWESFKHWCDYRGFTSRDINKSKKRIGDL